MGPVDFHQHLWPEPFVRALESRSVPPRLVGSRLDLAREGSFEIDLGAHALDGRLALLDEAGIDVAIVSLAATMEVEGKPDLVEVYHEGILELASAAGGRLRPLAYGACRDGFVGACVSAASVVDGIDELAERLEAAGQLLFVHPGPPERIPDGAPDWWAAVVDYPAQMQAAYAAWLAAGAEAHPGLRVVFAFLAGGGPFQLERLGSRGVDERSALLENVYFETCSYGRRALELCLATYQQDTGFHDHDVSSGAVYVTDGVLAEDLLRRSNGTIAEVVNERAAGTVFDFDAAHIHRMRHPEGGGPATSVHFYSPALWRMGYYEPDDEGNLRRISITYVDEMGAGHPWSP